MTSAEIRQSFLDYFRSKGHTIVPSASLMPASPNLLFTNAGMNQFVPIFLGQSPADVSRWPGAVAGKDTRAADTQKCIRAGGKHNDLEDVGLDTYHHTFFEMLGNWSFGDYFKKEAIEWAWELVTGVWRFPKERLYATVYSPDRKAGDPSDFDQEAHDFWAEKFKGAGLDPAVHIVNGGRKDNFWMMGDTGPCGPCSELHVDLTPRGDTAGGVVNKGSADCIEIWNLVFIQFNANPDGSFSPLPARHVDTGMGFERVTGIIQNTRGFTDFSRVISNYETDIFRPLFECLQRLSGKPYGSTLPASGGAQTGQEKIDVAFRVIADHIRTLGFAVADGIVPGNTDRNYVLRRILRRAVRYGRSLGFHEPFFYKLVSVLADTMGDVFPEIRSQKDHVEEVIQREEETFNKTLDRGIELFSDEASSVKDGRLSGAFAFKLYDTYGFPLDLTELMARERGLAVDVAGFDRLMEEQRARARAAQKREIIEVSQVEGAKPTRFLGYEQLESEAEVLQVVKVKNKTAVVVDSSPFYAEMGGQVGDTGQLEADGQKWRITGTHRLGETWLHFISVAGEGGESPAPPEPGTRVRLSVERARRQATQRHHTVTHLLHWALHEVAGPDATQKGSYVGPDKLTFDFSCGPLTAQQVADVERLVNERILENAPVTWTDVKYEHIRKRKNIMQFFGEKYGEWVRVVQIGGKASHLDGYSMELCGGTHTAATGELGLFRITGESAIAAGVRRIEALSGLQAYERANQDLRLIRILSAQVSSPAAELEKKIESLLQHHKELEKELKAMQQRQAAESAKSVLARARQAAQVRVIVEDLGAVDGDYLQAVADSLKSEFRGVVVLAGTRNNAVALVATVSPEFTKEYQAGKIVQALAPLVGGKGGGRPDNARGGGKDPAGLTAVLARARQMFGG